MSRMLTYSKAIREGIREEMLRDKTIFLLGEDIGVFGNVFGVYTGFQEEFGRERVIDTPISEEGFTGMAVGAAMRGLRPVVELMYNDFAPIALDPIVNQAAKLRYMTGGQAKVPLVIRAPMGAGRRNAGQHSQCIESVFCHFAGLKVVAPATAREAKGLIKAAIRDDDPVIFLEHKLLYAKKEDVPEEDIVIPLGSADVKRPGGDLTILAWSRQVQYALEAAQTLAERGIDAEVVDLRSLVPLDWEAVKASVQKTGNVLVVSEEIKRGSYAGELAAQISEELFDDLDAPVVRVCGLNTVSPFSPALEDLAFPHPEDIAAAAHRLLAR